VDSSWTPLTSTKKLGPLTCFGSATTDMIFGGADGRTRTGDLLFTNRWVGRLLASVFVLCMGKTTMCHPLASALFVSQTPVSQSKCQSNAALSCPCLCRAPVGLNLQAGTHVDAPRSPYCDKLARSYALTHCRWETRLDTEIGQPLRVGGRF
jgi:hypothetical protein